MSGKRKVLLATSVAWVSTARLAMAFAEMGCEVDVVCRRNHPVLTTSIIHRHFAFNPFRRRVSFERAIHDSNPDLVVSCDEPALAHLRAVHRYGDEATRRLVQLSVGDPADLDVVLERSKLMKLATEVDVGIPDTAEVSSAEALTEQVQWLGLPLVLKSDGSSGGTGVRLVHSAEEAEKVWRRLRGPVGAARTANRVLHDRDWTPILRYIRREANVVGAQRYVPGSEANLAAVCWQGEVLASFCLEVVSTWTVGGPSSVLRVVEQEEMTQAAKKIIRRLGFTGFCGFDFIFDPQTGRPLLLEMNPRPTQVAHLPLGSGRDLVAAICSAMDSGAGNWDAIGPRRPVSGDGLIALFPQEWQRDPRSPMLRDAHHDVPWSEPELVRRGINMRSNRKVNR